MEFKIKVSEEINEFMKAHSNIIRIDDDEEYVYMPYWFRATKDPLTYEILLWDNLPVDLKEALKFRANAKTK